MRNILIIVSISLILCSSCATGAYVSVDDIKSGRAVENAVCIVTKSWDLKGDTVVLPNNCKLIFRKGGCISNGTLEGKNSILKYDNPFIGDGVTIIGCFVEGKRVIRDIDVFLEVSHIQQEIQTLFDISGGHKIEFSQGVYENLDRVRINNNIDADFRNSTINLFSDDNRMGECFYMEPWEDNHIDYVRIKNLCIIGDQKKPYGRPAERRCIQLFYVSEVELDNISIEGYDGGPQVFKQDASDLLDKTRIGTSAIAIMRYDKSVITNCRTNNINKEIFWCVPNDKHDNLTFFTNNVSTCSFKYGSSSFFTLLDGKCIVKGNKVSNYNGSAFNVFCYDSKIYNNEFYDGKRSVAIDLSEGTMYKARNVKVHDNYCYNTKGLLAVYGDNIIITNNKWTHEIDSPDDRFPIIEINSRGHRITGGQYIGCTNNPEKSFRISRIIIDNNTCKNNVPKGSKSDIRFARIYGDKIQCKNNRLTGINVPVVQLVDGDDFEFVHNSIIEPQIGYYPELLINRGSNILVENNYFDLTRKERGLGSTTQILVAEGQVSYISNSINICVDFYDANIEYIPCQIFDYKNADKVTIIVGDEKSVVYSTGMGSGKVKLRTNISK